MTTCDEKWNPGEINRIVLDALNGLDGSVESRVSLLTGTTVDELVELGGFASD